MATSNDKISSIRKLIALGFEVHIKEAKATKVMVISIVKDAQEVGFIIDKSLNGKVVTGSAMHIFVEKVDAGWLQEKE